MARIIVTGYMIRYPVGGNLLAFLPYVLGLRRLGHEVAYLEDAGWAGSCFDPKARRWGDEPGVGLEIVRAHLNGKGIPLAYVNAESGEVRGSTWADLRRALRAADLLLNVGGVCTLPDLVRCRRRVLIDMDPLFTQVGKFGGGIVAQYHRHFSYGANLGKPGCTVPTAGIDWTPTVPPVIADEWTADDEVAAAAGPEAPLTTIGHWKAYGAVEWQGRRYGQKDEEFLRFIDLPARTSQPLELALSGAPPDILRRFRQAGWSVRDPGDGLTASADYRRYIARSRGEFSVAKNAYVQTGSGWFSDRTVCYLAAGRPAVVQDTGFTEYLPHGEGLIGFGDLDQAAAAIARINSDYPRHRAAARRIAREHFGHDVVLPRLLERALRRAAA
jgi:hypothetical protein